jgi:hypothetical protein
MKVVSKAIAI